VALYKKERELGIDSDIIDLREKAFSELHVARRNVIDLRIRAESEFLTDNKDKEVTLAKLDAEIDFKKSLLEEVRTFETVRAERDSYKVEAEASNLDINRQAIKLLIERNMMHSPYNSWGPQTSHQDQAQSCRPNACPSTPKHVCSNKCKEEEKDFYEGIVTYYRLSNPKLVKEEEEICSQPRCLSDRLKNKIK
jgi:hypothetical protein